MDKTNSPLVDKLAAVAPKLKINVTTSTGDTIDYDKEQAKSLRKQIKALEGEVTAWNADEVSKQALKKLKAEIARKRASLMELD